MCSQAEDEPDYLRSLLDGIDGDAVIGLDTEDKDALAAGDFRAAGVRPATVRDADEDAFRAAIMPIQADSELAQARAPAQPTQRAEAAPSVTPARPEPAGTPKSTGLRTGCYRQARAPLRASEHSAAPEAMPAVMAGAGQAPGRPATLTATGHARQPPNPLRKKATIMGDRAYVQIQIYDCPVSRRRAGKLPSEYRAELAGGLTGLAPRCPFIGGRDPYGEYLGDVASCRPDGGRSNAACVGVGQVAPGHRHASPVIPWLPGSRAAAAPRAKGRAWKRITGREQEEAGDARQERPAIGHGQRTG